MLTALKEEQKTAVADAAEYLRFGVGRRLSAIKHCLNTVFDLFPPREAKPLRSEQLIVVQISLQAFVINLSGIFDNFAWAFVLRHGLQLKELADKRGAPDRQKIGIFNPATQTFLPAELLAWANDAQTKTWHRSAPIRRAGNPAGRTRCVRHVVPNLPGDTEGAEGHAAPADVVRRIDGS